MALSCHIQTHHGYCIDLLEGTTMSLPAHIWGTSLAICNRGKKLLSYSEELSAKGGARVKISAQALVR